MQILPIYSCEDTGVCVLPVMDPCVCVCFQVVEDGYEFFAKRQLVTLFSAPNYCGEFDNAGAMMSVDETLMCSFQVNKEFFIRISVRKSFLCSISHSCLSSFPASCATCTR